MSTLRDRLWALRQIRDPREAVLLVRVGAFAAAVPLLTRLPLPRLAGAITSPPRRRVPAAGEVERLDRVVGLAPRVARPLVRSGCLTRGLTLFWFLRRAGLDVELRFGLDPGGAGDGHCWLTLEGLPFLEKADPRRRFSETYRLPLPSA